MIQLNNVNKSYKGLHKNYPALKNVNLSIDAGDYLIVVGKSGSGKSTLLNILSGIDRVDEGQINFQDKQLEKMTESEISIWRGRNLGIIFQFHHLIPSLTALDNILFAMELIEVIPKEKRRSRALDLLSEVGLGDKASKFPNELSGGEKQRVAIARALANDPPVLIADEPTGNLDSHTGKEIQDLFAQLIRSKKTIIQVTHENPEHLPYTKLCKMVDGVLSNQH